MARDPKARPVDGSAFASALAATSLATRGEVVVAPVLPRRAVDAEAPTVAPE
jgi:hypothetical protein